MAKIPLRAYLKEIEGYIERGEVDQAIAHAKNIIHNFPKQIDAYRLLGKAYLESQRFSEASDILQRVLAVIPEDFVAHIGMSIIREDEGNLDSAIWHMERGYEVQPFNPAVQDELRRLYGRRDGIEPPKIRLTRGALVRMYLRGELYAQAIAETRAALADDPQRYDLMVLLARLYFLSGQKFEATEICSSLISKLPYCLEANQILCKILPGTSRSDDVGKFQQRIIALDPYSAFITPSTPTSDTVPDQAVMVEQNAWLPAEEAEQTPGWAKNIGVEWEETSEEELPDWISSIQQEEQITPQEPILTISSEPIHEETTHGFPHEDQSETQEELVPDFMKEAGWKVTDRTADEIMSEVQDTEEIAPADIPEWLQEFAPQQKTTEEPEEGERTEWLGLITSETTQSDKPEQALAGFEDKALPLPDWFEDESAQVLEETEEQPLTLEAVPEWAAADETVLATMDLETEWSNEEAVEEEGPSISMEGQSREWLSEFDAEKETQEPFLQGETSGEEIPLAIASEETTATPSGFDVEIPEWLEEYEKEQEPAASLETVLTDESGEKADASQLEIESFTVEEQEAIVSEFPNAEVRGEKTEFAETTSTEGNAPDFSDLDAAMAWLEGLAARQGAEEETLTTSPEERPEAPPEWVLQEMNEKADTILTEELETEAPDAEITEIKASAQESLSQVAPGELKRETDISPPEFDASISPMPTEEQLEEMEPIQEGKVLEIKSTVEVEETEQALPDWLESLEIETEKIEEVKWETEPVADLAQQPPEEEETDQLPKWIGEVSIPSEVEGISTSEELTPAWLSSLEEEEHLEPEAPRLDLTQAWEAEMSAPLPVEVAEPTAAAEPSFAELQDQLMRGNTNFSLPGFEQIIQKGESLPEIIQSLREALYRFPVDISIWQTLGDAYARNNQLQEALDAYTKAEELLR